MRILLLGKNGQVGWELQRALALLGELIALDSKTTEWCGDLCRPEALRHTIRELCPRVIVNAAAYTAVDSAENDEAMARLVNAQAVNVLAEEAKLAGALLVHYSTDYVYPGTGDKEWLENDATDPVNIYGKTKREGEQAIERVACDYLIFRTSWVYATKGNNFAKTMLRLAKDKKVLSVINDQVGAPTGAELIADTTAHAIRKALDCPDIRGIYHLAARGKTTWHDYALLVFSEARKLGLELSIEQVLPIPTASYPTAARRPLNSRLSLEKLELTFGLKMPEWQNGVKRTLAEILSL